MAINATQIRVGMILDLDGELYKVTWTQHVTPGKGVACMQTKLKNIMNGKNLEKRFRSSDRVERANLIEKQMQYLYSDNEDYFFMDTETFDQVQLGADLLDDAVQYLVEEQVYGVSFYDEQAVGITMPNSVELKVTEAPPEIRKATASSSLRPITLENGMVIQAPAFIKEGDMVKVNTESGEYIERVK
ncbi:elongation factor P [Candidatus Marinamargulisbacteria bacterium SCGC AG-439-L15]|nr:elongation factor P [Candidatus Marinamargulisbacteria bacterium SCGC AG-439-L15]